jgi:very-short-patch-repair endonuclease
VTKDRARELRNNPTDAEKTLWRHLRTKQIHGLRFRRQFPIGPFIADFVCLQARLVIEVDGGQHADNAADEARTAWLGSQNFEMLRFWNNEVLQNVEGVVEVISARVDEIMSQSDD